MKPVILPSLDALRACARRGAANFRGVTVDGLEPEFLSLLYLCLKDEMISAHHRFAPETARRAAKEAVRRWHAA